MAALVIAGATALVYSNTFGASFHFDDYTNIVQNGSLRDLGSLWPPSGNRWLGYLSFALNYCFGTGVFGFHLVNTLIHLCNGLLVFWLTALTLETPALRRAEAGPLVRRYLPLSTALIFAVHPIATQAVTYIVQRFTSLATLLFILSLSLYAKARLSLEQDRSWRARKAGLYCLSVVFAAGAMKTKEISFTLPIVAAGYELLFFRPGRRLVLLAPIAATALLVPLGLASQAQSLSLGDVLGDVSRYAAETKDISRSVYLLTQSRVVTRYLRLLLWPAGQNLDYDFNLSHSLAEPGVLLSIAILVAVSAGAVVLLVRAHETNRAPATLVFFGSAWFFVTLSVESSVIPIRDVIFEHRVYLPSVGAAFVLGTALLWGVGLLRLRISIPLQAAAALVMTACPLGLVTYSRNFVWKDELTLWSDVVAKSPGKARPHNCLGVAYWERGLIDDAMREHRVAIRLAPGLAEPHYDLGAAYSARGEVDDAMREYREAIRLTPGFAGAHHNLGVEHAAKGQLEDAIREYREAIRLLTARSDAPREWFLQPVPGSNAGDAAPGLATAHMNLGIAYRRYGRTDGAIRELQEAIRLAPNLAQAHMNLGLAHAMKLQLDDAIREYRKGLQLAPGVAQAHIDLGLAYAAKRQSDDAIREYREAISLDPRNADVHYQLADAYDAKGQLDDSIDEYREAIRLDPRKADAHVNLGAAFWKKGRLDDAMREYREAIRLDPGAADVHVDLGAAYGKEGHLDDAIREYREAIRLAPALAEAHSGLGAVYATKGRLEDAVREYGEAIRLAPALAGVHANLGGILLKLGRAAEAIDEARRVLELAPSPENLVNLGIALEAAGRRGEALAAYQRFLDEAGNGHRERAEAVRGRVAKLRASEERDTR